MTQTSQTTLTAAAIRSSFLEFFRDRAGHTIVPSAPVVPHDDPTLLFTNAGMNQFKDVFLGTGTRDYTRAVDTQKCIRAGGKHNDLEDVGADTWHHTFFEMLGNWSFGDYFKHEAITWAWTLLTEVWELPKDRLHVTVFGGDEEDGLEADAESESLWKELTDIDPSQITRWGRKDNFWEMGATGPCGPCSEIHFDSTPDRSGASLVNRDHPDVIEFWNLVFIQFNRREDGSLVELPARHVDTGMGLERIVRILQDKRSNYDTDLWTPLFDAINAETGVRAYAGTLDDPIDIAYRVIADHVRCLTVALADGARPGADGRGYVLRRILRRGVRMARQAMGASEPLLCKLVPRVVESLGDTFPELRSESDEVATVICGEEEAFLRTIDRGLTHFADVAAVARGQGDVIGGDEAFLLHDTYGFPIDLTEQMAQEQSLTVDRDAYDQRMEAARALARGGDAHGDAVASIPPEKLAALEQLHVIATDDGPKFDRDLCMAHVRAVWNGRDLVEHADIEEEVAVLLDHTTFYGEQGGQEGDTGTLVSEVDGHAQGGAVFKVARTMRSGPHVLHIGHLVEGRLSVGDAVTARVDSTRRREIEANHTATHLVNHALRATLGSHVEQRGSLVAPDRLRFDYTAREAPDAALLTRIEASVREAISTGAAVDARDVPLNTAESIHGVRAVFGERYPDPVRVVSIGATVDDLVADPGSHSWEECAIEFCGGTHCRSARDIGDFILLQEQGLAAGIRRLVAATGAAAAEVRSRGEALLTSMDEADAAQDTHLPEIVERAARTLTEDEFGLLHRREAESRLATLRTRAKAVRKAAAGATRDAAVQSARTMSPSPDGPFVVAEVLDANRDGLLAALDTVRGNHPDAACLLAGTSDDKIVIVASVPKSLIEQGLKAGDWVRCAAQACGGGGGGRPDSAQAGGKDPTKLPDALNAARAHATETLT